MSVVLFIVILVVLIVGHEFGHFSVAKWVGMRVDEFGVGFPPKLWAKKIGETLYSINLIPFGGFVRIFGEDESERGDPRAFARAPKVSQAAVLAAGPFMNVVLGFFAFFIAYMVGVPTIIEATDDLTHVSEHHVIIAEVVSKSPAALAGIEVGDRIVSIDGEAVLTPVDIPRIVAMQGGEREVVLMRAGEELTVSAAPIPGIIPEDPDRFGFGIATLLVGFKSLPFSEALPQALIDTGQGLVSVVEGLVGLIVGAFTLSSSLQDVSGPVGIASIVGEAAMFGVGQVLLIAGIISLNLAVINLFPFPALDGGRLLMLGIEVVRGKAIRTATTQMINLAGFVILITLMLVVTYNDIVKLVG